MNLFIIGSDSFIARNFIKDYKHLFNIRSASRVPTNFEGESLLVDFFEIPESVFYNIDVVINFAAIVHKTKVHNKSSYDLINNKLTICNANKAKKGQVKLFIQLSSVAVYGNQSKINCSSTPEPNTLYGISKYMADIELDALQNNDFKIAILRLPMVYGGGNTPGNMMHLIRFTKLGLPLPFKSVTNLRDFIHVKNCTQYLSYIAINLLSGTYLITDHEPVSTEYLVVTISELLNKQAKLFKLPNSLSGLLKILIPSIYRKLFGSLQIETNLPIDVITHRYSVKEGLYEMISSK